MSWSIAEIERDWLAGAKIPPDGAELVDAFDLVDAKLGPAWLGGSRTVSGAVGRGSSPTVAVVQMGRLLRPLTVATNHGGVLERIRQGDGSAVSEAIAVPLLADAIDDGEVAL